MVKKLKLHEIGNFGNFNHYIFDKKQEGVEELFILFYKTLDLSFILYENYHDKKGNCKQRKINFGKKRDFHISDGDGGSGKRVDLFFGDKLIFVLVYCNQKLRLKFNEELGKISVMPKPKKLNKKEK